MKQLIKTLIFSIAIVITLMVNNANALFKNFICVSPTGGLISGTLGVDADGNYYISSFYYWGQVGSGDGLYHCSFWRVSPPITGSGANDRALSPEVKRIANALNYIRHATMQSISPQEREAFNEHLAGERPAMIEVPVNLIEGGGASFIH